MKVLKTSTGFLFMILLCYLITCEKLPDTTLFNPVHSGIKVDTIEVVQIDAFSARVTIHYSSFAEKGEVDSILLLRKDSTTSEFKIIGCFKELDSDSIVWIDTSIVLSPCVYQAFGMLKGKPGLISSVNDTFTFPLKVSASINKLGGFIRLGFEFGELDSNRIDGVIIVRKDSIDSSDSMIVQNLSTFYQDSCLVEKISDDYRYLNIRPDVTYKYVCRAFQKRGTEIRYSTRATLYAGLRIYHSVSVKPLSYDSSRVYFSIDEEIGESAIDSVVFFTKLNNDYEWNRAAKIMDLEGYKTGVNITGSREQYYFHLRPILRERRTKYRLKILLWIRADYYVELEAESFLFPIPGFRLIEVDPEIPFILGDDTLMFASPCRQVRLLEDYWIMETEYVNDLNITIDTTSFGAELYNHQNELPSKCSFNDVTAMIESFSSIYRSYFSGYDYYDFDLPTEAEWEYAASVDFPAGNQQQPYNYNWGEEMEWGRCNYASSAISPVKSYPPGLNGLFEMNGNLAEWVIGYFNPDFYGTLNDYVINPIEEDTVYQSFKIIRGGSFKSITQDEIRNQARFYIYGGDSTYSHIGFRLVFVNKSNRFNGGG